MTEHEAEIARLREEVAYLRGQLDALRVQAAAMVCTMAPACVHHFVTTSAGTNCSKCGLMTLRVEMLSGLFTPRAVHLRHRRPFIPIEAWQAVARQLR